MAGQHAGLFQPGNQAAAKGRRWADAISRALEQRSKADQIAELDKLAEKLLDLCREGDLGALKELGDRLDGKPRQQLEHTGEGEGPIRVVFLWDKSPNSAE